MVATCDQVRPTAGESRLERQPTAAAPRGRRLTGDPLIDDLMATATRRCHAPLALLSLTDGPVATSGASSAVQAAGRDWSAAIGDRITGWVISIPNTMIDARLGQHPAAARHPFRSMAGAPLTGADETPRGMVWVLDTTPRVGRADIALYEAENSGRDQISAA